jgi:hypothetical protein
MRRTAQGASIFNLEGSHPRGKIDAACSRSTASFVRDLRENTDDKISIEDFFLFPAPDARFFYRAPSI